MRQRFSTIFALLVGGLLLLLSVYFAAIQSAGDAKLAHSRTAFPLTGAHVSVECTQCHVDYVFKGVPRDCVACHQDDENHDNRLGVDCAACHTSESWRLVTFNHAGTAYALTGAHLAADCAQCHENNVYTGTPQTCIACHWSDDAHAGKLGTDCAACHSPGWRQATFDHTRAAFALTGAHAAAGCTACHRDNVYAGTPQDCVACHRAEDAHDGQLGEGCSTCHTPGWRQATFDHTETAYPLIGAHALVPCAQCHADNIYKTTPQDCVSCHRADDTHDGRFGTDCGACHTPGWQQATFDHSRTDFALTDTHKTANCASCHPGSVYKDTPQECISCHRDSDAHDGERGTDCAICHTPAGWE